LSANKFFFTQIYDQMVVTALHNSYQDTSEIFPLPDLVQQIPYKIKAKKNIVLEITQHYLS
uniref:IS4 family transposase n=1 Tax=Brugia timori TaxID=42155 RepID=A0A0R3QWJ8_9BILA